MTKPYLGRKSAQAGSCKNWPVFVCKKFLLTAISDTWLFWSHCECSMRSFECIFLFNAINSPVTPVLKRLGKWNFALFYNKFYIMNWISIDLIILSENLKEQHSINRELNVWTLYSRRFYYEIFTCYKYSLYEMYIWNYMRYFFPLWLFHV